MSRYYCVHIYTGYVNLRCSSLYAITTHISGQITGNYTSCHFFSSNSALSLLFGLNSIILNLESFVFPTRAHIVFSCYHVICQTWAWGLKKTSEKLELVGWPSSHYLSGAPPLVGAQRTVKFWPKMPLRLQKMALPMYFKLHQNILYFETTKKTLKKKKKKKKNSNTWER